VLAKRSIDSATDILFLNRVQHLVDWSLREYQGENSNQVPDFTHKPGITHFREG